MNAIDTIGRALGGKPKPGDDAADCTDDNPEQSDPATMIRYLAGLSSLEYEQKRRAVAEALGVRASALDRAVKEAGKS
ncbi:MAG: hypothetical protein PHI97_31750 [Desulfobulbus sp.]|nr:hypothetical protein [Desulfobulbus sp.]